MKIKFTLIVFILLSVVKVQAQTAHLILNEVNPYITGNYDLVELFVTAPGSVNNFTLYQGISSPVLLATFPQTYVSAGDFIIVHMNPTSAGNAPASETINKTEYSNALYSANYDMAWDFNGIASVGMTSSSRVIVVRDSAGNIQDAVPFTNQGLVTPAFVDDVQYIQGQSLWFPSDCGGYPCDTLSTPSVWQISVDWTGCGNTPVGNSVQRVTLVDNNIKTDWGVGSANTWSALNSGESFSCSATGGTVSNVTCNALCNGVAGIVSAAGNAPYTYSWWPSGSGGATATDLCAGNYTISVTDAAGCTTSAYVTITEPSQLAANGFSIGNDLCNGDSTGSAAVTANGGTGSYSYDWSPYGGSSATATNLSAGTYTVTVTDENGCMMTSTSTITEPTLLVGVVWTISNASCQTCADGSAAVMPNGGTPVYTYLWTPSGQTSMTATNLLPGNNTCCVTDANGCSTCSSVHISYPTEVQDIIAGSSFTIFPNPVHGTFTISFKSQLTIHDSQLIILDVTGREVYTEKIQNPKTEIRNVFSPGIYLLKVQAEGGEMTQKLVMN